MAHNIVKRYNWVHILIFICIIGILNLFMLPLDKSLISHKPTLKEPKLSLQNIKKVVGNFHSTHMIIGNSMVDKGIDMHLFNNATRVRTFKIGVGATASAWWYLLFKNGICRLKDKPKIVTFIFRDYIWTRPAYRVTGNNKNRIDLLSIPPEEVLDKKAYFSEMSSVEYFMKKYVPSFQKRLDIQDDFKKSIKKSTGSLMFNLNETFVQDIIDSVFDDSHLNKYFLSQYQFDAEQDIKNSNTGFDELVENSFLPDLFSLAAQNDIKLIFVRYKSRRDVDPENQPKKLLEYTSNLESYIETKGGIFIDMTNEKDLTEAHYAAGDHLNAKGKAIFTNLLSKKLYEHIQFLKEE